MKLRTHFITVEIFPKKISKGLRCKLTLFDSFYKIAFFESNDNILLAKRLVIFQQIKPYKIDLPVVYDWENWSFYQEFNKSFYNLTQMANKYMSVVEKAGYKAMLYSSKNYLEKAWLPTKYPVWLAHYTWETNYSGKYTYWQLCSNGKVPGISGSVDINVYYKNKEE